MEISPVTGIRVMPVRRAAPVAEGPSAVFDMERLARPADDSWAADGEKPPGGQDDADNEPAAEDTESADAPRQVNFFV
jgi:hypothetical protein